MRFLICAWIAMNCLQAHDVISTKLTWTQEISRIVYKHCLTCHHEGGSAPMALLKYEEARPWAKAIKDVVLKRQMPPWGAVKGFGDFKHDPSLSQDEIIRIAEWVEGGAPEGDPAYLPAVPKVPIPVVPPGVRSRKVRTPVTLNGVRPLASVKSAQIVAELPDGSAIPLLWLEGYDIKWKRTFVFRSPIQLPAQTKIVSTPPIPLEFVIATKPLH